MLIVNANLVTWETPNRILENHALYIQDGLIREIGPTLELARRHPDPAPINAEGQLIFPGNICAHTHFYGAFARGLAIPGSAPSDFPEILEKLWWRLDRVLDLDDIRYSVLVCLIDAIKHGTTTLFDHHASPNAINGSLDIIAEVMNQTGVRGVLCYEVTDRGGEEKSRAGIAENVRFLKKLASAPERLLAATFGLHASLTLSDRTLDLCREAVSDSVGFHIHVAEGEADEIDSLTKSGMRVVQRLDKHNILSKNSILAHAVKVDENEIELIAKTASWVTHQPRSNMNNGVGVAPVEAMLKAGIRVGLGNDGLSNAMWEEWKAAYLVHKAWNHDPRCMPANDVLKLAVHNNRMLAELFFHDGAMGKITPGAYADLIFVDYHPFTTLTPENLPWHILFGFNEDMLTTTIIDGKLLMKDHKLLTIDEESVIAKTLERVPAVWKRFEGQSI